MGCAVGAEWVAKKRGFQDILHEVFLAGLLHDVGKIEGRVQWSIVPQRRFCGFTSVPADFTKNTKSPVFRPSSLTFIQENYPGARAAVAKP